MKRLVLAAALALPVSALAAPGYASKKPDGWTQEEINEIQNKSPWVVPVEVFPAALIAPDDGMKKPIGSIQRVPVRVIWASSGIFRNAEVKQMEGVTAEQLEERTRPNVRFYSIRLHAPETLSVFESAKESDLMAATSLTVDGTSYPLAIIMRPSQFGGGPIVQFFFERGAGIPADAKTAVFKTKAYDASFEAKFKLDKMVWLGKRDLDGDVGELTTSEKRRRDLESAVLAAAESTEFHRSLTDVKLEKRGDKDRPFAAYIFYDPSTDVSPDGKAADAMERKLVITQKAGTWSASNNSTLQAIVFVNPRTGKADDYILAADAEKIAKLAPESAAKTFKEKLVSADKKPEAPKDGGKKKSGKTGKSGG